MLYDLGFEKTMSVQNLISVITFIFLLAWQLNNI